MKERTVLMAVLACLVCVTLSFAENPNMGTWKLNEAKSKISAGWVAPHIRVLWRVAGPAYASLRRLRGDARTQPSAFLRSHFETCCQTFPVLYLTSRRVARVSSIAQTLEPQIAKLGIDLMRLHVDHDLCASVRAAQSH